MINVWIDEMTPCLKDNLTGELISTEVLRVRRKSFLQNIHYNRYLESLKNTPEPILLSQMPVKMNIRKVADYAKDKGVRISSLSKEELKQFLV